MAVFRKDIAPATYGLLVSWLLILGSVFAVALVLVSGRSIGGKLVSFSALQAGLVLPLVVVDVAFSNLVTIHGFHPCLVG